MLTLVPLLGVLLMRKEATFAAKIKGADAAVDTLRRFCGFIAHRMVSRPGLYTLISVLVIAGLGFVYVNLQPRYRLADLVPDKEQAVAGERTARRQAHRRQPARHPDRVPQGGLALRARRR